MQSNMNYRVILAIQVYINDNIKNLRPIANTMGISYQQLYQKIYNRETMDIATYSELCSAFGVKMDYFINKAKEIV